MNRLELLTEEIAVIDNKINELIGDRERLRTEFQEHGRFIRDATAPSKSSKEQDFNFWRIA